MYIKLSAEEIEKKSGTFFLWFNDKCGLGLYVLLGRNEMNYCVSYYVDGLKFYEDYDDFYVEETSLKRALNVNFSDIVIVKNDLEYFQKFKGKHFFKIPDTIPTQVSTKDLLAWYLKNKMTNDVPKIEFSTESIFTRIPVVKEQELEVGQTYLSKNEKMFLYVGYYNNSYMFYIHNFIDGMPHFYQAKQLIITTDIFFCRWYAGFKKIPNLYKISDYPEALLPRAFVGFLKCLPKITVCVK